MFKTVRDLILRNRRYFSWVKYKANGMLAPFLYRLLYEHVKNSPDGNIVEVGAGHGASTISLGLGLKDIASNRCVHSFEKCEGGSRSKYGTKKTNLRILRGNIELFDLEDYVKIHPVKLKDSPDVPEELGDISLMFLDADGRLDRDFQLFYNRLVPGATIVIDDYKNKKEFREVNEVYHLGATKYYRTYCYLNHFKKRDLFDQKINYFGTVFGEKPRELEKDVEFDRTEMDRIEEHIRDEYEKAGFRSEDL